MFIPIVLIRGQGLGLPCLLKFLFFQGIPRDSKGFQNASTCWCVFVIDKVRERTYQHFIMNSWLNDRLNMLSVHCVVNPVLSLYFDSCHTALGA